jgi:hypothetical protein
MAAIAISASREDDRDIWYQLSGIGERRSARRLNSVALAKLGPQSAVRYFNCCRNGSISSERMSGWQANRIDRTLHFESGPLNSVSGRKTGTVFVAYPSRHCASQASSGGVNFAQMMISRSGLIDVSTGVVGILVPRVVAELPYVRR